MAELLVEFFSEEIPARMQLRAAVDLKTLAAEHLGAAGFVDLQMDSYVTPRRLVLVVHGLPAQQPDRAEEIKGPRVDAPEQALKGFMQANGLTTLGGVEQRVLGKAVHYFVTRESKGAATNSLLPFIVHKIVEVFPWPKSMHWGVGRELTWVRPLQQVNVIFDGKVIMGGGEFKGHRFLSSQPFTVNNFAEYKSKLCENFVILDQSERHAEIAVQAEELAVGQGLTLRADDAFEKLLDEVTGLVEWPTAMLGAFEKEYLSVPQECLIATMRANQKYFPLFDAAGKLANHFIVIANVPGVPASVGAGSGCKEIISGNERVLRARLSDAKFFYEQDLKTPLATRVEKLKTIQFHEKLGTLFERTRRITEIAKKLAAALGVDARHAARAAELCKADLVTGMVDEFPELQGIMGRYYALAGGEDAAVVDAIRDHYQPLGPTAAVPNAPVSIVVALADKLDSLNEFFRIGEKPTGSKDPYALRRAALGIIRIILENKLTLPLAEFVAADVLEFIKDRLQVVLRDQGMGYDRVKACITDIDDVMLVAARVSALNNLLLSDIGEALLSTYRRTANILKAEEKKDNKTYNATVETSALQEDVEKTLASTLIVAQSLVEQALADYHYSESAAVLASLQPHLAAFFADVMVNADDQTVRANRLNLLGQIRSVFHQFADFSQLEG